MFDEEIRIKSAIPSIYVLYNWEPRLPVDLKYLPPVTDDVTASVFEHHKRVVESSS